MFGRSTKKRYIVVVTSDLSLLTFMDVMNSSFSSVLTKIKYKDKNMDISLRYTLLIILFHVDSSVLKLSRLSSL
jgi:hypothetical protein